MTTFSLHFFKKQNRNVDYGLLRAFFEANEDFQVRIHDSRSAEFVYTHQAATSSGLYQTKSSRSNIYRIMWLLDVNVHIEIQF